MRGVLDPEGILQFSYNTTIFKPGGHSNGSLDHSSRIKSIFYNETGVDVCQRYFLLKLPDGRPFLIGAQLHRSLS